MKADRIQEKTSVDKIRSTFVSAFVDFVLFLFSRRGDKTTVYSQLQLSKESHYQMHNLAFFIKRKCLNHLHFRAATFIRRKCCMTA